MVPHPGNAVSTRDDPRDSVPLQGRTLYTALRKLLSAARRRVRFGTFAAHDRLACTWAASRPARRTDTLVIRTNRLGDFILWLDAAKEIGRIPALHGRRVLLTATPSEELHEELSPFDEVWPLDVGRMRHDLAYRRRMLRKVASRGFAITLNTVLSRDPLIDDAVVRASRATRRIGAAGDVANATRGEQRLTDTWYTELHPAPSADLMELQRAKRYFGMLGAPFEARAPRLQGDYPPPTGLAPRSYYVLGPGASWAGKAWPIDRFREIARRIHERTGLAGVACGAAAEADITAELCSGATPPLADVGGKTSVRELFGLVAHAAFVVTNDTSVVHIAAAAGVPAVVILGGGHFGRFLPYATDQAETTSPSVVHAAMPCFGCDWRCKFEPFDRGPKPCITNVSVDDVWRVVETVLPAAKLEAARLEPMSAPPDAKDGKRTRQPALGRPSPTF
jgi:hypothetical protein